MTLPCLKVEFDGSSATSIVTARRKVISSSLSSLLTAEALLHSADFSITDRSRVLFQSRTLLDHAFGLRFQTSLLNDVTLKSFKG